MVDLYRESWLPECILHIEADGLHDDAPGLNAWFQGRTVSMSGAAAMACRTMENEGNVARVVLGGQFGICEMLRLFPNCMMKGCGFNICVDGDFPLVEQCPDTPLVIREGRVVVSKCWSLP